MPNCLSYTSLVVLSVLSMGEWMLSSALAQPSEFTGVDLVCYMQTAEGETIDLSTICGRKPQPDANSAPTRGNRVPLSPYTNLGGLEIYGRGNNAPPCFGLDDRGRPCPSNGEPGS